MRQQRKGAARNYPCKGTQGALGKWRPWHRTPPLAAMPQAAIFSPLLLARQKMQADYVMAAQRRSMTHRPARLRPLRSDIVWPHPRGKGARAPREWREVATTPPLSQAAGWKPALPGHGAASGRPPHCRGPSRRASMWRSASGACRQSEFDCPRVPASLRPCVPFPNFTLVSTRARW